MKYCYMCNKNIERELPKIDEKGNHYCLDCYLIKCNIKKCDLCEKTATRRIMFYSKHERKSTIVCDDCFNKIMMPPKRCPECRQVLYGSKKCSYCGYECID